ncbi:hypothetical protein DFH07DRAFT_827469 [Mycena maculata]|uniref:Uncharacterized protein n=1 Tax=Mycena maculata TaxID=230809 RepID=A0AAD7N816_9AGAR|nr:hypothetical protein DFH07DRAFT_827469 [Mycena maculata]
MDERLVERCGCGCGRWGRVARPGRLFVQFRGKRGRRRIRMKAGGRRRGGGLPRVHCLCLRKDRLGGLGERRLGACNTIKQARTTIARRRCTTGENLRSDCAGGRADWKCPLPSAYSRVVRPSFCLHRPSKRARAEATASRTNVKARSRHCILDDCNRPYPSHVQGHADVSSRDSKMAASSRRVIGGARPWRRVVRDAGGKVGRRPEADTNAEDMRGPPRGGAGMLRLHLGFLVCGGVGAVGGRAGSEGRTKEGRYLSRRNGCGVFEGWPLSAGGKTRSEMWSGSNSSYGPGARRGGRKRDTKSLSCVLGNWIYIDIP